MIYGTLYCRGASRFNCARVENGDQGLVDRPSLDGSHENLANIENGHSNSSSKLDPLIRYLSSSSNYDYSACIPYVRVNLQGAINFLLLHWDLVDKPIIYGSHGNFANFGDGNSDGSSKLYPYSLSPSYYSND